MRKHIPILMFIIVQLASVTILVLWILFYLSSRSRIQELTLKYGIDPSYQTSVLWLLQGIIFILPVIGGASVIFTYWTKSKRLDTMRTNFISSVSHELLTPLASLRLYTETMQIREIDREKQLDFLKLMIEDSERLAAMIAKLLRASRIERRKALYTFEEHDLAIFIQNFVTENPQLTSQIRLSLELAPACSIRLDIDAFGMILKNLLENAVRYSPRNEAMVTIGLRRQKKRVELCVSDHGYGLEKSELRKIFRMFYRVTSKNSGTGLGLYIVKNAVEAHRGKIWATSPGLGQGATFTLSFPASSGEKHG
jgi:signal transduction histidine kinase